MTPDGSTNGVCVLDAIPVGELNTARRIYNDLRDVSAFIAPGLFVKYYRVETQEDLSTAFEELTAMAKNDGLNPWLHLEGHGLPDESGFCLAEGEACSWEQLRELLVPLNVACNLNVLLLLATCFGGSFAKVVDPTSRAPVLALVGPVREIQVGEIEIDFPRFYKVFFESGSIGDAIAALTTRAGSGLYFGTAAKKHFVDAWRAFKKNECTPLRIEERARAIRKELKGNRELPHVPSLGRLKRMLLSKETERAEFEKYSEEFFMFDVYPANRARFHLTYDELRRETAC